MTTNNNKHRTGLIKAYLKNLIAGLRALVFLRPKVSTEQATWNQFVMLALTGVAIHFVFNLVAAGDGAKFTTMGFGGILFYIPLGILSAWIITARIDKTSQIVELLVVFSAIEVVRQLFIHVFTSPFIYFPLRAKMLPQPIYWLTVWWYPLTCGVASLRLVQWDRKRSKLIVLVTILMTGFAAQNLYLPSMLWYKPRPELEDGSAREKYDSLNEETVFYLQPKLLDRAVGQLAAERHHDRNLFFIGVAGDGEEDVFMKELFSVHRILSRQFDVDGHSILLINNAKTARNYPIASVTSLGVALTAVAAKMDKQQDILLLYLTSHGSQNHEFSLDLGSMHFDVLNPGRLRQLLDDSGIVNRLIVISACYSGGFIPALQDENTAVITSAAADRTSFGCGSNDDYTYFGRAYFEDALKRTDSFVDAFDIAKPIILQREKEAGATESDPQMYVGGNAKKTLNNFAGAVAQFRQMDKTALINHPILDDKQGKAGVSTPPPENLKLAQQFISLLSVGAQTKHSVDVCIEMAHKQTAEDKLRTSPDYFWGLTTTSKVWPQVAENYLDYQLAMCSSLGDFGGDKIMADVYASHLTKDELLKAIQFVSTPAGKAMVDVGPMASEAMQREMTQRQREIQREEDAKYMARMKQLVALEHSGQSQTEDRAWWNFWR